jgi:hypothetical protein
LNSILFHLVQFLVLDPVESRITSALAEANAPQEIVAQIKTCTLSSMPVLLQKVGNDPWWGAQTAVNVWVRGAAPEQVISELAPACGPAMQVVRPYLRRAQAT